MKKTTIHCAIGPTRCKDCQDQIEEILLKYEVRKPKKATLNDMKDAITEYCRRQTEGDSLGFNKREKDE